jgi:AcrR family transcriptional regulator
MSKIRTRPSREEVRARLFEAAAQVFEEHGIGSASIEAITEAAGFSRGAFYSNFANKDELIIAMLEDHVEQSTRRNLELLARHDDLADFVAALAAVDRELQDPLGRAPLLHMELILYTARASENRPELAERLRSRRELIAQIIATADKASGPDSVVDPSWAPMLLALEDGFRLHRLIDPLTTPEDSWNQTVIQLLRVIGLDSSDKRHATR